MGGWVQEVIFWVGSSMAGLWVGGLVVGVSRFEMGERGWKGDGRVGGRIWLDCVPRMFGYALLTVYVYTRNYLQSTCKIGQ